MNIQTSTILPQRYTLITGASEGFGKSLAIECAQRKMNLILVALPGPELFSLADFLKRNYGVDVIGIEKDLCKDESCRELFEQVKALNLEVNMLINNAGIISRAPFGEVNITLYEKQIKLNVLAATLITNLFFDMLKRNGPSYILNVSSMASFFYLPQKQVYGATKSYINFLSRSLHREFAGDGIHVSVLCPGSMNTTIAFTFMKKSGNLFSRLSYMEPEEVAKIAIEGLLKRKEVIIPGRLNKFFMLLDKILPGKIKKMVTCRTMKKIELPNTWAPYLPDSKTLSHPPRAIV